jgi:hypothetical protein
VKPRSWVAIALTLSSVLAASAYARAETSPTARLVYVRGQGADTCADEETLKAAVAARLGYDPFRPFVQNTLFAEVHREKGRFVGSVKMVDASGFERGARRLEEGDGSGCDEITATMALTMSIAIDPRRALTPAPAPQKPPDAEVASEPSAKGPLASADERACAVARSQRRRAVERNPRAPMRGVDLRVLRSRKVAP